MLKTGVKIEMKSVENMKEDDELEMLLGEIPDATSLNLLHSHSNAHFDHHNHRHNHTPTDHGYGHASFAAQQNVNYHGHGYGMCNDVWLKHKYACASSPVCGFSLKSDGSSSSLFSGGCSISENGSSTPPAFEQLKPYLIPGNGFFSDLDKGGESGGVDELNLSRNFSNMYISDEQERVSVFPKGYQFFEHAVNGSVPLNPGKYGASDNYKRGFSDYGGFGLPVPKSPVNFNGGVGSTLVRVEHGYRFNNLPGSIYSPGPFDGLSTQPDFSISGMGSDFCRNKIESGSNFPMGFPVMNLPSTVIRPSVADTLFFDSRNGTNVNDGRDGLNSLNAPHLTPQFNAEELRHYQQPMPSGRDRAHSRVRAPQGNLDSSLKKEDSLIIHGEALNYVTNKGLGRSRGHNNRSFLQEMGPGKLQDKRSLLNCRPHITGIQENDRRSRMCLPFPSPLKFNSLVEAQGYIYYMAKDQHGCRFLQKMFDEGSPRDVQIIFSEIIDHAVELMMNPFGNYLMQKLLEVCNEDHRTQILLRVTHEPGELVTISLNTHGTRVVQKLIETLKTRQQILLVISALEPGFLALIKDLNGNHVVQRCLECFTTEDSKFIFTAAAKYCTDIATHQHGCCVLQRCIRHSTGEHRENLIAEISANGLFLAQDAFGNYVVQFILDHKIPSATAKLISLFEGKFVHLSIQKFSSHVVEKCLVACDNEIQTKIIHELLSATYFEQLLQDPHANYVIQKALQYSEGPIRNTLVDAIESHKAISRNSPYSKRIFSHKLLKK